MEICLKEVIMHNDFSKAWWKAALIRSVRTMAQTAVAMIPVGVMISEVNWMTVTGTALLAGVVSMLTSVAGLPEVEEKEGMK